MLDVGELHNCDARRKERRETDRNLCHDPECAFRTDEQSQRVETCRTLSRTTTSLNYLAGRQDYSLTEVQTVFARNTAGWIAHRIEEPLSLCRAISYSIG